MALAFKQIEEKNCLQSNCHIIINFCLSKIENNLKTNKVKSLEKFF